MNKLYVASCFIVLSLLGCKLLTKPVVTKDTVNIPAITNTVVKNVTNIVSGIPVVEYKTNVVFYPARVEYVEHTNYVADPILLKALQDARNINNAITPAPFATPINWGLSGLVALAGGLAAWQTKKLRGMRGVVDAVAEAARIAAVEAGRIAAFEAGRVAAVEAGRTAGIAAAVGAARDAVNKAP